MTVSSGSTVAAPQPPVDLVMPSVWQTTFLVATSIVLLGMTVYALRKLQRDHDPVPVLSILGGCLVAATIENVIGPAGLLWYPSEGQTSFMQFAGRSLPLFIVTGNGFWYGPALILLGDLLKRARSRQNVWMIFGAVAVVDVVMEALGSAAGVFVYYGDQGIRLFGFPLWWDLQNAALTVLLAWVLLQLRQSYLKGWRVLLIVPLIPCLAMAGNGFEGLFAWLAINSDTPWTVIPGTLASMGMALVTVDFIASLYKKKAQPVG